MYYVLYNDKETPIESSGACKHCGLPNQQTDNLCGTHKDIGWRMQILRKLFPRWRQFQKVTK